MKKRRLLRLLLSVGLALFVCSGSVLASPTLKMNSHGHDVLVLQKKLQEIGYHISQADGVFGSETERAVAEFQRDQKMSITGIVNNATWRALKKAKPIKKTEQRTKADDSKENPSTDAQAPASLGKAGIKVPYNKQIMDASQANSLISTAKKYIGVPYQFGGTTPKGFDCSGYLQYVFAKHGMQIPRLADEQYRLGTPTKSKKQLVPGDLVFFTTYEAGVSHCGIYLGNDNFIHASSSRGIRIDKLSDSYWQPRYVGGKHIVR